MPVRLIREALFGCEAPGRALPCHDARDHRSDKAGAAQVLGGEVRGERDDEAEHAVRCRVRNQLPGADAHPSDDRTDDDGEEDREGEVADELPERERAGGRGRDRGAKGDESAVASLRRLSPSRRTITRRDRPSRFAIAVATASVGLRIAPRRARGRS